MAVTCTLPFSTMTIDGTAITTAQFVFGSGTLTLTGVDIATTTADNKIRRARQSIRYDGSCVLHGDLRTLATDAGLPVDIVCASKTFQGHATVTYDAGSDTSNVTVTGKVVG